MKYLILFPFLVISSPLLILFAICEMVAFALLFPSQYLFADDWDKDFYNNRLHKTILFKVLRIREKQ